MRHLDFVRDWTTQSVRIRSPRADEVARALRRETVSVTTLQDGALRFDGISASVKTHVGRVLAKLGARDCVQAVNLAHKLGIVES